MSIIYEDLGEIDIPKFAHYCKNGRVIVVNKIGGGKREQIVIGRATSRTKMFANSNFKIYYPHLWRENFGKENLKASKISIGLYGLFLSAAYKNGLYKVMKETFGVYKTNRILDYAMFNTHEHLNASYLITEFAKDQLLFSEKKPTKNTYCDFFKNKLGLDLIHQFRLDWLKHCASHGYDKVWLCIDGSNNDCSVQNSKLAANGNSKSHNAVKIYSYMWAVSAKDGRPITYTVNNGSKVDSKAFDEIGKLLAASKIKIEGIIVDRGFATEDCIKLIRESGYKYVVMLKSNALAYKSMFEQYASKLFWNFSYAINGEGDFGVVQKEKIFASSAEQAHIGFYFNGRIGTKRALDFLEKVFNAKSNVQAQIDKGKKLESIIIPADAKRYVKVFNDKDGKPQVEFNNSVCQGAISSQGYNAIACSEDYTAQEISELYDLRDVSEKQFSVFKSQLGNDVTRVHSDESIEAKLACGFIASIIRTEIAIACKALKFDTNKIIREADFSRVVLVDDEHYRDVHDHTTRLCAVFKYLGLEEEYLDCFSQEVNNRNSDVHSHERVMPPFTTSDAQVGRPRKDDTDEDKGDKDKKDDKKAKDEPKRGPGRPKGSKNKKTLEKERKIQEAKAKGEYVEPEKRGRGRPKGSKNKKTLEREAKLKAQQENRGRGRPKGSKNKKTLEREAQQKASKSKAQKKASTTEVKTSQSDPKVQPQASQPSNNNGVQNTPKKSDQGPQQKTNDRVQSNENIPPD